MKPKKSKSKPIKDTEKKSKRFLSRLQKTEDKFKDAISSAPRITNETVSEHREEVLGRARKYIYPLKHSRHNIVRISLFLLIAVVFGFFIYTGLELYNFQSTSGFVYTASEVVPFPVAKAGNSYVSYYSYLFELRRNIHYYQTQQQANFSLPSEKAQLDSLKKQAMNTVIEDAYVKQLASKYGVSVSNADINNEINLVKQQNRLGNSDQVLNSVLKEYWGWTEGDFKKELSSQLLQQKVIAKLDTSTNAQAQLVHEQLVKGSDFAKLATTYSQDASTKTNGGQYVSAITQTTANLPPQVIAQLYKLKPGQISPVINTGYSLEILKVISVNGNSITASHIQFNLKPITDYTNPLKKQNPPKDYITT